MICLFALALGLGITSKAENLAVLLLQPIIWLLPRCFYISPPDAWLRLRKAVYAAGILAIFAVGAYVSVVGHSRAPTAPFLSAFAAVLVVLGLYDHWLFTYLLRSSRPACTMQSHTG